MSKKNGRIKMAILSIFLTSLTLIYHCASIAALPSSIHVQALINLAWEHLLICAACACTSLASSKPLLTYLEPCQHCSKFLLTSAVVPKPLSISLIVAPKPLSNSLVNTCRRMKITKLLVFLAHLALTCHLQVANYPPSYARCSSSHLSHMNPC